MPRLIDLLWSTLTLRDWYGATVFNHLAATTQSKNKWRSARYYAYVLLEKMRRILSPVEIRHVLSSVDFDGDTAALKAARNGCTRLAKMLLSYGPEAWDVPNKNGECAREVIERAARRKEERERERLGYGLPAASGNGGQTVQHQRIDPQLSAAAVEAVNNVNAHVHAHAQAEADAEERDRVVQGGSGAGHVSSLHHHQPHTAAFFGEQQRDDASTLEAPVSGAGNPAEEVLAQIAPILNDAYRKLTAAFEPPLSSSTATTAAAGGSGAGDGGSTGPVDISDPRSLYNHLEADRANIRKQLATLREEEAKARAETAEGEGVGKSLDEMEEEYERIRAAYEDLVERAQEKDIKRELEKEEQRDEDVEMGGDENGEKVEGEGEEDASFVDTYKLLQLLVQVISTRRSKVQELIDGCTDVGCISSSSPATTTAENDKDKASNTTTAAQTTEQQQQQQQPIEPVNPNLRRLVSLATGLKESELDEMADEIEATLNFDKSGSMLDVHGSAKSGAGIPGYLSERIEREKENHQQSQSQAQEVGQGGIITGTAVESAGQGEGDDDVIITESQKTIVDVPAQMDVDPAMEQQQRQEEQERTGNVRGVEIMN